MSVLSSLDVPASTIALMGAVAYGGGDFMGGRAAVRLSAPGAVALAQCAAMLVAFHAFAGGQVPAAPLAIVGPGIAGGIAYAAGLLRLYQGVARGRVAVVAPVCGVVGILVPLAGDLILAREIGYLQLVGIAVCAAAIVLLARASGPAPRAGSGPSSFRLGVESGLGYGAADLCLGMVAPADGADALAVARCVAALIAIALLVVVLRPRAPAARSEPPVFTEGRLSARLLPPAALAIAAGAFDALGHMSYVHVATQGSMAVASAIVALFPAVLVLLAVVVLRERITARQWAGLFASLAGITLMGACSMEARV